MSEVCANCGKGKEEAGKEKLPICTRCQSRAYCSKSCQQAHWVAFHRAECKSLKEQRESIQEATGVRPTRGSPAVMSKRNLETGRSDKHMTRPKTKDHQMANMRQSLAGILETCNKNHSSYNCFASQVALSFGERRFEDMKSAFQSFSVIADPLEKRMNLGYSISEFNVLVAITRKFPPGPALRKEGVCWDLEVPFGGGEDGEQSKQGMKPEQLVSESLKIPPLWKLVLPYHMKMNCQLDAFRRVIEGPSGPTLEHINLIGTAALVNDDILKLIAERCPNLEYFVFGQDNRYYPPDDITMVGLVKLASGCKKLRFLRILHRCKTLDSSDPNGLICSALKRQNFTLRFIPDAEEQKKELALGLDADFWRADVEDGLTSASWYERFESNQQKKEFFAKHFPHWI